MLKNAKPSEYFVGAILRAFDQASEKPGSITASALWTHICIETATILGGFTKMFEWDESKAQSINRIHTIRETISRGFVPGLVLAHDDRGREIVQGETPCNPQVGEYPHTPTRGERAPTLKISKPLDKNANLW